MGGRLDAVGASWRGWPAVSVGWAWLRWDSDSLWSCRFVDGARAASYTVTPSRRRGSKALALSSDLAFRQAAVPVLQELDGKRVASRRALDRRLSAAAAPANAHRAAAAELEPFVAPGARQDIARADAALAAALR